MDGLSLVLNVWVGIWLILGAICLLCWSAPRFARHFYFEYALKCFLIATAMILALMGLMKFVRMEE